MYTVVQNNYPYSLNIIQSSHKVYSTFHICYFNFYTGTARSDFLPQLQEMNQSGKLRLIGEYMPISSQFVSFGKRKYVMYLGWDPPGYGLSRPPNRTFPSDFFARDARVAVEFMRSLGYNEFSIVG